MRRSWGLVALLVLGLLTGPTRGAPGGCAVVEGVGIGGVRLGMTVSAALAVVGRAAGSSAPGTEVIYELPAPWSGMVADYGFVQRIATRTPECQTTRGIAVGANIAAVREAYAGATVIATTPARDGNLMSFPFLGIRFLVRGNQVEALEVFYPIGVAKITAPAPEAAPSPGPPSAQPSPRPSPTPTTAAGTWSVRSAAVRFDDADFVVSGTVENRSQTQSAFAEVQAFNAAGRRVGGGNAPLVPSPVPSGGISTFEVRLGVTDVVRRYVVTIRPAGAGPTLAEYSGEVKNLQLFGTVVAKQLQVQVQATSPTPARSGFVVVVTNTSTLPVASASVTVEINATCRFGVAAKFVQETWTATVTVQQLAPGASVQSPLPLSGGICDGIAVSWTASTRVGEVKVGD